MPEIGLNDYDRVKKVLCSLCKKEFEPGQRFFGQAKGVFEAYGYVRGRDGVYTVPRSKIEGVVICDYFHEECLR